MTNLAHWPPPLSLKESLNELRATVDCTVSYRRAGRKLAAAFVRRDLAGLRAELEFERMMSTATA
ncbi:MAG TPA: hypothetical protein VLI41_08565 [Phenylobacterium sp.]|uniref:hypothetical protein n=1 Tax=Phenylobacterium sp. TaxID=1871053 RepID=UPI002C630689|nr:hypothetical protein [Phenylobacterium sp.]HSV03245.1 hypothetical protein [Phenylobacterium sp.]